MSVLYPMAYDTVGTATGSGGICMQAAQVEVVVTCCSEMDTTLKTQKSCIKAQLCSLHAGKRQYLATVLQL